MVLVDEVVDCVIDCECVLMAVCADTGVGGCTVVECGGGGDDD